VQCVLVPLDSPDAVADAIVTLLRDPESAAQVGRAGRELVREHFALDVVLQQHLDVLSALAAKDVAP
jgi:glycosyltransferase involved in cell wall biosynthesis